MFKKHQTFRYTINRIQQLIWQYNEPKAPWLTKNSIYILDQLIDKSDIGLEFGSGRSTKWFAKRCYKLMSVEHNLNWYNKVKKDIEYLENVDYRIANIVSGKPKKMDYLSILSDIPDSSIDFILNDGKIRDLVATQSIDKLAKGGIYILDNAERYLPNNLELPESRGDETLSNPNWITFSEKTSEWRRIWTTDGVSSTLILFKL